MAKVKEMALKVTETIGLKFLSMLLVLGNASVGQVTVWHMVFFEILMRLDDGRTESAIKVFSFIFGSEKGKGEYTPAVKTFFDGNIEAAKIWGFEQAQIMLQQIEQMEYSPENIRLVCLDCIAFARAFQERTIDAVKNFFDVIIPYEDLCRKVRLLCRWDDPEVKICWTDADVESSKKFYENVAKKDNKVQVTFSKAQGQGGIFRTQTKRMDFLRRVGKNIKLYVADVWHQLECNCIRLAQAYAKKALSFSPSLSDKMMGYAEQLRKSSPEFAVMAYISLFYKENMFRSLSSLQTMELENNRKVFKDEQLREQEKATKGRFRAGFKEIGNCIKLAREVLGNKCSLKHMTLAAIWASFHTRQDKELVQVDDRVASNFADTTLEAEFAGLMHQSMLKAGENVATEATVPLSICLLEDGDTIEFIDNVATSQDGKTVLAEVDGEDCIPDGEYTIRWSENGCRAFAAMPITNDLFKGEEADGSHFAFMLSFNSKGYDYKAFCRSICNGKEITLLPYKKGLSEKNLVIVDGQVAATYRGFNFAYSGVVPAGAEYAELRKQAQALCNKVENAICGGKTGTVSAVFSGIVNGGMSVVVLMDNVKNINPKDVEVEVPVKKAAAPAAAGNFQLNMAGLVSTLKPVETPPVFSIAEEVSATSTVAPAPDSVKK